MLLFEMLNIVFFCFLSFFPAGYVRQQNFGSKPMIPYYSVEFSDLAIGTR